MESMTTKELTPTVADLRNHPAVQNAATAAGRVIDFARRRIPAYADLLVAGTFPEDRPEAIKTLGSLMALAGVTPDVLLEMVVARAIEVHDLSRIARGGGTYREVDPARPAHNPDVPYVTVSEPPQNR
jgi:hypothetical protein